MFGPFTLCQEQYNSRLHLTARRQSLPQDVYVQLRRVVSQHKAGTSERIELKVQHGQESHLIDMYLSANVVLENYQAVLLSDAEQKKETLSLYLPDYMTKLIFSLTTASIQSRTHLSKFRDALFPSLNACSDQSQTSPSQAKKKATIPLLEDKENREANNGQAVNKKTTSALRRGEDCPLRSDAFQCSSPFLSPVKSATEDKEPLNSLLFDVTTDLIDMTQLDDELDEDNMNKHEIRNLCIPTQAPLHSHKTSTKEDTTSQTRPLERVGSGFTPQAKRSTKNKSSPPPKNGVKPKSPPATNNLMRYFMANKKSEPAAANQYTSMMAQNPTRAIQRSLPFAANTQQQVPLKRMENSKIGKTTSSTSSSSSSIARNLIADPLYSTVGAVDLSQQQTYILDRCLNDIDIESDNNNNVFYTGGGGTGKSLLLKQIIARCVEKFGAASVYVTATTGLAACAIGGSTIHQFLGIPAIDEEETNESWESLYNQIVSRKSGGTVHRIMQAKVLIIDEISMLGPKLFDFLDRTLRKLRNKPSTTMGGIQIICCGDFFQLPPVSNKTNIAKSYSSTYTQQPQQQQQAPRYCFQAQSWNEVFPPSHCFELEQVYRQAEDSDYVAILNDIRVGKWSLHAQQMLQECVGKQLQTNIHGVMPTIIFTHKRDVDNLNQEKLKDLVGESFTFQAKDTAVEKQYLNALQRNCPARDKLILKVGAQVILVKTISASSCYGGAGFGLVNGARGVVVRFNRETKTPVVKFTDGTEHTIFNASFTISVGGRIVAERSQVPLDLAWGISVHKAQGMSVDQAELHLKNSFETGQVYVALSRVRSRAGLSLKTAISMQQIRADPIVVEFYQNLARSKRVIA